MALVLSIIHVISCFLIIGVILLQSGKGGGMGAGFGGASAAATQLFGGRGAGNFLSRSTVGLATVFMATSLGLAYLSSRPNSLLDLSETSGRIASDEDTIVERGSGDLIELGADAAPAPAPQGDANSLGIDLQELLKSQGTDGGDGNPIQLKLDPAQLNEMMGEPSEAPAEPAAAEPVEAPKPQAKPAPKPRAKPAPKPQADPAPKPEEANPAPKPEEVKPAPTTEEAKPEAEPAQPADAPTDADE